MLVRSKKKFGFILPVPRERAFTLAELLIATGITAIIVVLLGTMLGSLTNAASRASQRIDAFRDARAALQIIERDMANLVQLPATSPPLMSAAYFALADSYTDPNTATSKNQQLYALCAMKNQQVPSSSGDICAVGYYCRWDTNHYVLCRYLRPWNSGTSPTTWQTFQTYQSSGYAPASALYTPNSTDEILATYVWNFNVTMYKSDGTVLNSYPYTCDPNALPAAIEISFNAMSPQAARTVMSVSSSPTDWMDTTSANYQRLILPHMYQFRTRINFQ